MPILVTCANCQASYTVPEDRIGQQGRCRCGHAVEIQAPSQSMNTVLPEAQKVVSSENPAVATATTPSVPGSFSCGKCDHPVTWGQQTCEQCQKPIVYGVPAVLPGCGLYLVSMIAGLGLFAVVMLLLTLFSIGLPLFRVGFLVFCIGLVITISRRLRPIFEERFPSLAAHVRFTVKREVLKKDSYFPVIDLNIPPKQWRNTTLNPYKPEQLQAWLPVEVRSQLQSSLRPPYDSYVK